MADPKEAVAGVSGARWIRAALQVNPYTYKGRSSPGKSFADEAAYNAAIISKCHDEHIDLIAITDHWAVDSAAGLIEAAQAAGIVALPGFEANSSEGCHLLVLFEAKTALGKVNAAIGACGVEPGCANGTSGKSYDDILREMSKRGALVVPAHANVASSGLLTLRGGGVPLQNAIKHPDLHALGVSPGVEETKEQKAVFAARKPFDRPHKLAAIYADDVCRPSDLALEGAVTWFKVSEPCLASIKHAVRTPQTRVRREAPAVPKRARVRSLTWTGGFLDGSTVNFSDDLTSFIGGRGTGKSTVIESLRHVLGVEPISEDAKRDHDSLVRKVLTSGTVIELVVEVVTPVPGDFTIRRTIPDRPVVLDVSGTATKLAPEDIVGSIEIFGQHELAEVAQQPSTVAKMVRRFAGDVSDGGVAALRQSLADNRALLDSVEREQHKLEEELAAMPRLEDQLEHFKDAKWPAQLDEQQRLSADKAVFAEGNRRVEVVKSALAEWEEAGLDGKLRQPYDNLEDSPRAEHLQTVKAATDSLADAAASAIGVLSKALSSAVESIASAEVAWETSTADLKAKHAEVLRSLKEQGYDPDKFIATKDALKRLELRAQERPVLGKRRAGHVAAREKLLGELGAADTAARKVLAKAVRSANRATGKAVVVRPVVAQDRTDIEDVIDRHVQNSRKALLDLVRNEDFSPSEFVSVARRGQGEIMSELGFTRAQADAILSAGEPFLREMEEQLIGQEVEVLLDISPNKAGDFRELGELSKGQRATALLLLLLGASDTPLVIDQPEDDLDNRFVFDGLVTKLRTLKGKRQIIVSTHNANVPVLGDAELIVTLDGNGRRARPVPESTGSLDLAPVRKAAEHILEGGREAFDARRHLYGF